MSIAILPISGCNVLKFVPKGKSLLDVNFINVEGGGGKIPDLKDQILLMPNRKMLGVVKFNLWSYYVGQKLFPKDTIKSKFGRKVKSIFCDIVGENPVYLDNSMITKSEKNLKVFLYQKGYYEVTVSSKVKTYLKRSYITYNIHPGVPYYINNVIYNGTDILLDKVANEFAKRSIVHPGDKVDDEELSKERDRLTTEFRNNGFYYFNKAFIEIAIDTGGHNRKADIYFNISNPGTLQNARQQTIQKVVVEMNYKQQFGRADTLKFVGIEYVFRGYNIKPNIINRSIVIRPHELFSQKELEETYRKLMGLGLFKYVNISVLPYKLDTTNKLVVYISLMPMARAEYIIEPQTITSDKQTDLNSQDNNPRNYGIAASIILNNKNVFRNAEEFNIKFRTAAEKQFGNNSGTPVKFLNQSINLANYESNLTFELLFPKLVGLRKIDLKPYLQQNRTSVNLSLITEINTNYSRKSLPINYTWQSAYSTKDKQTFYFYYSPIQVSFNSSEISPGFLGRLNNPSDSLRLVRTFLNYIIPSQKASIVYSNIEKSPNNYWNIRSNIFELSGNLIEFGFRNILNKRNATEKKILGLSYFQYFRTDIDVVKYRIFDKNKTLVMRGNIGYGIPYGNSLIMPLERQFFVGGSNSIRGWRPRVLGPGNHSNTSAVQIDKTGDMMIVANIEYRFAIAPGKLDGAFFMDAGNIWEVTNSVKKDAQFKLTSFYTQTALNTGFGLRLDLQFFILRFDFGIPLYDPSEIKDDRWVIKDLNSFSWIRYRVNPSLAVGLPF